MLSPEVENDLKARGSRKLNYSFIDSMIYDDIQSLCYYSS